VTVCVAASCQEGMIVCASDRMLTAGNVEFEPELAKIIRLTNSVFGMMAGNASIQAQIMAEVLREVNARVEASPDQWWRVSDVAALYARHHATLRLAQAEAQVLWPLGLDRESFISRQTELAPTLLVEIARSLTQFDFPATETIFAGLDGEGRHIYTVNRGVVAYHNTIGFAAIGIGASHANSQFMYAGHSWMRSLSDTLLQTYWAKKRAEAAPGVGTSIDMFTIGPVLGASSEVGQPMLSTLESIYNNARRATQRAEGKARVRMESYVRQLLDQAIRQQQANPSSAGEAGTPPESPA